MLHGEGFGAARPVEVPWLIGASGPKGLALARELGSGVFSAGAAQQADAGWHALLVFGTVLDDGEEPTSGRAMEAGGPGLVVALHGTYEWAGAAAVDGFPGGQAWREAIEAVPANERHLAVHEGHLVFLNDRDRRAIADLAPLMTSFGVSGDAKSVREKLAAFEAGGVTEVAYQPSGPDIPRELGTFIDAVA
jgi:5,10-methylenetetrahydromethanopterin reductase